MTKKEVNLKKYSVVPKFWMTGYEMPIDEFIVSQNNHTKENYVHFYDSIGRFWTIPEKDCIIVINVPSEGEHTFYRRIKEQMEKNKQEQENTPSVHQPQYG